MKNDFLVKTQLLGKIDLEKPQNLGKTILAKMIL